MSDIETSRANLRELCSLFDNYCTITKDPEIEPERRYDLVMGEPYMGRIKALFKSLGVSPNLDYWGPHILGYDTCVALAESEIKTRLQNLAHVFTQK
jgi:hypothetical protein